MTMGFQRSEKSKSWIISSSRTLTFVKENHSTRPTSRSGARASTGKRMSGKALVGTLRKENGREKKAMSFSMVTSSRDRRFRRKPDVMVS